MDKKITIAQIKEVAQQAYDLYRQIRMVRMPITFLIWRISIKIYSESVFAF